MSPLKTLLISEIFPPKVGGSGRWFWEIYSRLDPQRYLVASGKDSCSHDFDKRSSLECMRWPLTMGSWGITTFSSVIDYVRLFILLRATIKKNHIEAVHCGRGLPEGLLGLLGWKCFGIPYLCYVHGEELPAYQSSREYKFLSQLVYANAKRIIVNSANTQKTFVSYTGIVDTVRTVHPGVDTTYFKPKARDEDIRRQLKWSGRKVILTVGRLQKRKGHDHVICAIKQIRKQVPDLLYVIVGGGEERAFLEELVVTENVQANVQFLGEVKDGTMLACYQQCDLFVLANREVDGDFEGFGMVLVEAQACSKPVLTGNSGGTPETLVPRKTGMVINAENSGEIAKEVIGLLSDKDKRFKMGERGVAWVKENFDCTVMVAKIESIFDELQN